MGLWDRQIDWKERDEGTGIYEKKTNEVPDRLKDLKVGSPNINRSQESEFINCDICGKKEKNHKRSISKTIGANVNFKHDNPENIQYTCLFCGNKSCYEHSQPDSHYCSYSIWNPHDKKKFLNSTYLKRILLVLAILFAYFLFMNSPINLESIDNITSKFEILDVHSFFENDKTNNYVETYEHIYVEEGGNTIYVEEGGNTIYVGGDGYEIYLQNNPDAIDPTYSELVNFIKKDKTDQIQYSDDFVCADYAELVHNNAEANGIKTAWVAISFYDNDEGHALNAFNTLDKGLVYIDSTGGTEVGPCSYDRLIGIEIGKPMWYYELYKCNDDYYYPPFISSKVESIDIIW